MLIHIDVQYLTAPGACVVIMSLLEQSRSLVHVQGLPPNAPSLLPPHPMEGAPNSDVLLALLARNKSLEGKSDKNNIPTGKTWNFLHFAVTCVLRVYELRFIALI